MAIFEVTNDRINRLAPTKFGDQGITERGDLQRLLRDQIDIVAPDTFVLAEEFGSFDESLRRIDLLAIDKDANLVVVELKRTQSGGHMDLQAIRYAAMVSAMTFDQAASAHARYLRARGLDGDARQAILDFLGWDESSEDDFAQEVRLVLVAADFSKELTTSVMWLNDHEVDVRCVRLHPYVLDGRVLVDVQQIIPLPEAAEYQVLVREKARRERSERKTTRDLTKYDVTVGDTVATSLPKRRAVLRVVRALCKAGVSPAEIHKILTWRVGNLWRDVAGEVSSDEFVELAGQAARKGGPAFEARRWFLADDELIVSHGRTWALNKGWGARTEEALEKMLAAFDGHAVSFKQSSTD